MSSRPLRRRDDTLRLVLIALLIGTMVGLFVLWNRLSDFDGRLEDVERKTDAVIALLEEQTTTTGG